VSTPSSPVRSPEPPVVRGLLLVAAMAAAMWVVEIADQIDHGRLERHGIVPRSPDGLEGIAFAPFLHAGWDHLIGNTLPFLVLGAAIALGGLARVALVTVIVAVVGGAGTWLVAPANTIHIGASGIVFGYAAYLIARGVFSRRLLQIGLGVVVVAIWGTTLLNGLAPADGISWQGHLFGAAGGVLAAWLLDRRRARATGASPPLSSASPARAARTRSGTSRAR
jgi:membrane associated rhomboid family serine protease